MRNIFIDTSYFIALANIKDLYHNLAKEWARRIKKDKIVCHTSIPIVFEIADGFSRLTRRKTGQSLIYNILNSKNYIVHPFNEYIYLNVIKIYFSRNDKEWGLTDCYSFQLMKEQNISKVLTADKHFKQFGMEILLKI
jgi:predicted nucleic acid-binding protein